MYSGTAAALAYALLERGRGRITRAVIAGPTHRVGVRGVVMSTATAFATPLGVVPIDVETERRALGLQDDEPLRVGVRASADAPAPALMVNDATHAQEHAVEVQIPILQQVLGPQLTIVPLNVGDARPEEVADVLKAFWGGPETVIVISSDLSHYHPEEVACALDDETIERIAALDLPIHPRRACGAYPVNGLLELCRRAASPTAVASAKWQSTMTEDNVEDSGDHDGIAASQSAATGLLDLRFLGCSTSGDHGEVALSGYLHGVPQVVVQRPAPPDPNEPVVGYASFAAWQTNPGDVLLRLARTAIQEHLGVGSESAGGNAGGSLDSVVAGLESGEVDNTQAIIKRYPWLRQPGACFVTLTEGGALRGCIGSLIAQRPLGEDVAAHAVDAAARDPRFLPVQADEYPQLSIEVSVLSKPTPMAVNSRQGLEQALRPGKDGLIISDGRHQATFLPQVWDELPEPHDFVSHLLAKAGLRANHDWRDGSIHCSRYAVTAYKEKEQS